DTAHPAENPLPTLRKNTAHKADANLLKHIVVKPGNGSGSWWLAASHVVSRLNVPGYVRLVPFDSNEGVCHG
ncbi:hypothetical protein, partial [Bifidobacterium longum]|uniref:hypothetical protein n=1 Tax=Bifidobacterium longum TaxID=216816 RepID=UPI001A955138